MKGCETDAHLLCAKLHREAILRFTGAAGQHFQVLGMAARFMELPSCWKRRAREIDAALGLVDGQVRRCCGSCFDSPRQPPSPQCPCVNSKDILSNRIDDIVYLPAALISGIDQFG